METLVPTLRLAPALRLTLAAACLTLTVPHASAQNPYCVSGANWAANGVMENLSMPADSLGYIWDTLQVASDVQMVRPCRYWAYVGVSSPHRSHGYHEVTDTIDDATAFGAWVDAHPGKIWIIGNEPDLIQQDGITPQQYAAMYHTYTTFISARDASATFAVAALSGDTPPSRVQHAINWWETMLSAYKTSYGDYPRVDIWNFHCYTMPHVLDAARVIDEYVTPFINWAHAFGGGIYADAEIWCTEFGVALWVAPMRREVIEPYMAEIGPRMEAAGVDRFFWFLGPWAGWDGTWEHLSLLYADKSMTNLGQLYSALANNYPNPIPAPTPNPAIRPMPRGIIEDDFEDGNADGWFEKAGEWTVDQGAYRQVGIPLKWGTYTSLNYEFADGSFEADVRIDDTGGDSNRWVGFVLRQQGHTDDLGQSGYLVFLRARGAVGFYTQADGAVVEVAGAVASATEDWVHLKVEADTFTFRVFVNGIQQIEYTDPHQRWRTGRFNLQTGRTDSRYDNVRINAWPAEVRDGWRVYR